MPKSRVSESAFQAQVVALAQTMGWRVQHSRPSQVGGKWMTAITGDVGFPDLVLAHRTKGVVFAELKTQHGRLSAEQIEWRNAITHGGGEYHLWRPDDLQRVMKRLSMARP